MGLPQRLSHFYAVLLFLLACFTETIASERETAITFGVVPQHEPSEISKIWQPIIDQINADTGLRIQLKFSTNIPEFEREFSRGDFDFAYMNPYHSIIANAREGYQPVLRDVARKLYGIIVVKKDSPITTVEELDGETVAFPAPNALGAALIPRAEFENKFKIKIKESFVKSHDSVYLNVLLGLAEAGGGVRGTYNKQPNKVRDKLRVLYSTLQVSPHPIVVHPRVSIDRRERVVQAFLELSSSVLGNQLFSKVPFKKLGRARASDYDELKSLGLSEYYVE